jgi:hypothetical protein
MTGTHSVELDLDLSGDTLTLNERIAVEEVCGGRPFDALRDEGGSSFYRALVWVAGRRNDPRFSLEEAGQVQIRLSDQE